MESFILTFSWIFKCLPVHPSIHFFFLIHVNLMFSHMPTTSKHYMLCEYISIYLEPSQHISLACVTFSFLKPHRFSHITGVTFSSSEGLSRCQPCSQCPLGVPQLERCTLTQDTHCDCGPGFFLLKQRNKTDSLCAPCAVCGRGEGVVRACGPSENTVCQPCGPGTFSEDKSYSQSCRPCSWCKEGEVEIRQCHPKSDTLCMGGYMILNF